MYHSDATELVYLIPFVTAIALMLGLAIGMHNRAPVRDWTQHAFPPVGAHYIARLYRTRVIVAGVIAAALAVYGWASEDFVTMMEFSFVVFLFDAVFAAQSWRAGTRALAVLRRDGATVALVEDVLVITGGPDTTTLGATPWLLARARRHALPKATL
ncbi:MAG: hypothetical protein JO257_22165 [Deltaproteobacteria bacterium]|nr:hypothetical protein [Deltaproteobacteria bacterium]